MATHPYFRFLSNSSLSLVRLGFDFVLPQSQEQQQEEQEQEQEPQPKSTGTKLPRALKFRTKANYSKASKLFLPSPPLFLGPI